MDVAAYHKADERQDGCKNPSGLIRKWAALFLCFFLVWVFMFVIAPWIEKMPAVRPLAEFIEESGIDASALFYTDVEEASEAELNMYNTMKYFPGATSSKRK